MNEKKYIIEVSHVNKNFKNNKVLKDVTLRCESGRIYGLVGHCLLYTSDAADE